MKRVKIGWSEIHVYGISHGETNVKAKEEIERIIENELYDIVVIEGYGDYPFHKLKREGFERLLKAFQVYELVKKRKVKRIGVIDPAILDAKKCDFGFYISLLSLVFGLYFGLPFFLVFFISLTSRKLVELSYALLNKKKREDFMTVALKKLARNYKKVLAIVGASHEKPIYKRLKNKVKVNLWKYYKEYMKKLNEDKVNYGAIVYFVEENKAKIIPYYPFIREFELKNGLD